MGHPVPRGERRAGGRRDRLHEGAPRRRPRLGPGAVRRPGHRRLRPQRLPPAPARLLRGRPPSRRRRRPARARRQGAVEGVRRGRPSAIERLRRSIRRRAATRRCLDGGSARGHGSRHRRLRRRPGDRDPRQARRRGRAPTRPLVTLESDKATMDVPSPFAGKIVELKVEVGDKVSEGTVIATIEPSEAGAISTQEAPVESAVLAEEQETDGTEEPARPPRDRLRPARAGPAIRLYAEPRRCAASLASSASTSASQGDRPQGADHREDVKAALTGRRRRRRRRDPGPRGRPVAAGGLREVRRGRARAAVADQEDQRPEHRAQLGDDPPRHPHDEADITDLEAFRKQVNSEQDVKVTMVALLIKACVGALRQFPEFNSSLDGDELVIKRYYHLGFAADTPQGLLVPVIQEADRKGLLEIARRADASCPGRRARARSPPRRCAGSTFTISSLGGIGGTGLHSDRQRPRGRDPRRHPLADAAGLERRRVRAAADLPALPLLRPPRHRRRRRRPLRRPPRRRARRPAAGPPLMEVKVPDIGDFADVPVIEIHVTPGDAVGRGGAPRHARVRQGDDGRAGAGGRHGHEVLVELERQGLGGHARSSSWRPAEGERGRQRPAMTARDRQPPPEPEPQSRPRPGPPRSRGRRHDDAGAGDRLRARRLHRRVPRRRPGP